jgi:hypothetical protein
MEVSSQYQAPAALPPHPQKLPLVPIGQKTTRTTIFKVFMNMAPKFSNMKQQKDESAGRSSFG